jgi:hypothetical protein
MGSRRASGYPLKQMIEGAWSRFLEYAAHARTKPTFDVEERQPKLEMAARLRESLEAARDGGDWVRLLRDALRPPGRHPFEPPRYNLVPPRQLRWLNAWAQRDPESLRAPLVSFLDPQLGPVERFAGFARAAERDTEQRAAAGEDDAGELGRTAALTLGSLLNFSVAPESLPIVRGFFSELQELLGVETPADASLVDRYAAQVEFARDVRDRLESASVTVVDMIDVQSLIVIGAREQVLWAQDPPADWAARGDRQTAAGAVYLAVCSVYLNEAPYLREWIEFHRLVGVERFFLYDNGSTDDHLDVLEPYIDDGIVTLREWKASPLVQRDVFDDCIRAHREDARWIAFLDLDEFLFSPTDKGVAELLHEYERWPAIGVSWAMFSHSGHQTRPDGLVIESYKMRDREETGLMKMIVDPLRTVRCENAHWFSYDYGLPVDENGWPLSEGQARWSSFERLRINHYASRSRDELGDKVERGGGWNHLRRWRKLDLDGELDLVHDDSIARLAPALEAALGRAKSR